MSYSHDDTITILLGFGGSGGKTLTHLMKMMANDPRAAETTRRTLLTPVLALRVSAHWALVGGADCIVLCDTNGGSLPWQVGEAVEAVLQEVLGQSTPTTPRPAPLAHVSLSIHAHNDSETGVANTLEAV